MIKRQPSREELRQLERENMKQPMFLAEIPKSTWPPQLPPGLVGVWRSRGFLVQRYECAPPALCRLSVCRTTHDGSDWLADIPWEDLQRLKSECGFAALDAVEIYPSQADVVNISNMRHLWILPAGSLPFAWRSGHG